MGRLKGYLVGAGVFICFTDAIAPSLRIRGFVEIRNHFTAIIDLAIFESTEGNPA